MCGCCFHSSWNGVRSSAHTVNIWNMFSTLVVSKLSGWLNADAPRFKPWLGLGYIGLGLGLGLELWFMVRFGGVRVRVRVIGFRIGLPKVKARRGDAHCSQGPGYTQEGMR